MKLKAKRLFPVILALWPYLYYASFHVAPDNATGATIFLGAGIFFSLVVYISNMIYASICKEEDSYYYLAFWNMMIKLIHVPIYLLIVLLEIGSAFLALVTIHIPIFLFMAPILIIYLFFAALLLMIVSSTYGVNALIRAGMKRVVSKKYVIVNIILHFFFVADVISAIVLYKKVRKEKRERESEVSLSLQNSDG